MNKEANAWARHLGTDIVRFLGSGDAGNAYETADGKVIKITDDKDEFLCAHKLLGRENNHIADVYDVKIFNNGKMGILLELLETNHDIENAYYELEDSMNEYGKEFYDVIEAPIEFSPLAIKMKDHIIEGMKEATLAGFNADDHRSENIGMAKNGNIKFFDQREHRAQEEVDSEFDKLVKFLLSNQKQITKEKSQEAAYEV